MLPQQIEWYQSVNRSLQDTLPDGLGGWALRSDTPFNLWYLQGWTPMKVAIHIRTNLTRYLPKEHHDSNSSPI